MSETFTYYLLDNQKPSNHVNQTQQGRISFKQTNR